LRGRIRILRSASDSQAVDSVFVGALTVIISPTLLGWYTYVWRAKDGSIPAGHHNVVAVGQSIRARAIPET